MIIWRVFGVSISLSKGGGGEKRADHISEAVHGDRVLYGQTFIDGRQQLVRR